MNLWSLNLHFIPHLSKCVYLTQRNARARARASNDERTSITYLNLHNILLTSPYRTSPDHTYLPVHPLAHLQEAQHLYSLVHFGITRESEMLPSSGTPRWDVLVRSSSCTCALAAPFLCSRNLLGKSRAWSNSFRPTFNKFLVRLDLYLFLCPYPCSSRLLGVAHESCQVLHDLTPNAFSSPSACPYSLVFASTPCRPHHHVLRDVQDDVPSRWFQLEVEASHVPR